MFTQNHKIDDEGLEQRLKTIAGQPMTKQEVREQRISFVYGQLPHRLGLTKEYVEKRIDEMEGRDDPT